MAQSLNQLEARFAQAGHVDAQRQVVEEVRLAHARTQALYRGALKGVWIGIALMVLAVVLAVFFAGDHAVWLIILPALLFGMFVFAAVGLALAKRVHGYRYSRVIALQENTIWAAQQRG